MGFAAGHGGFRWSSFAICGRTKVFGIRQLRSRQNADAWRRISSVAFSIHPDQSTGQCSHGDTRARIPKLEDLGLENGDAVTVAMSGGVDSSVTLAILAKMPLNLDVIFMRNWDPILSEQDEDGAANGRLADLRYPSSSGTSKGKGLSTCTWERDWEDVRDVCREIGIPSTEVRLVDFSKEYWSRVFEPCVDVWENGGTPNPDVMCNREIKFGALLDSLPTTTRGRTHFLATGHYAQVHRSNTGCSLHRAVDRTKDQSYYLSALTREQIQRTVLPLGAIRKAQVRDLARQYGLPTADREESMGVCFIGERGRFGDFVSQYTSPVTNPGRIITPTGEVVGAHQGLWYFTIGQRARLSGRDERWFVARKGVGETGQDVMVVPGSDHPYLLCSTITASRFRWISGMAPIEINDGTVLELDVQIRHRMVPVRGRVNRANHAQGVQCEFLEPLSSVSPGQVLALYDGDRCLGSGVIDHTTCPFHDVG